MTKNDQINLKWKSNNKNQFKMIIKTEVSS